jgi:hypothetical protein
VAGAGRCNQQPRGAGPPQGCAKAGWVCIRAWAAALYRGALAWRAAGASECRETGVPDRGCESGNRLPEVAVRVRKLFRSIRVMDFLRPKCGIDVQAIGWAGNVDSCSVFRVCVFSIWVEYREWVSLLRIDDGRTDRRNTFHFACLQTQTMHIHKSRKSSAFDHALSTSSNASELTFLLLWESIIRTLNFVSLMSNMDNSIQCQPTEIKLYSFISLTINPRSRMMITCSCYLSYGK